MGNSDDPEYQEMVSGDDLILAIEVSRANAPVEWYCNEKRLVEDSRTHIETYGTLRKLIITDIKSSDSGKYMCDAVNDKMATVVRVKGRYIARLKPVIMRAGSFLMTTYDLFQIKHTCREC